MKPPLIRGAILRILAVAALSLLLPACARALREPPSVDLLGGAGASALPGEVNGLLHRARLLYAVRTREKVQQARDLWLQAARGDESRIEGLIGTARASAWLAEHEEEGAMRLQAAEIAVQAGQLCDRARPGDPGCAYWLAAGLGLQARERRSTALDALPRIEELFTRAAADAPSLEQGGPDRALALLYVRAPGWPTGPGDPDLAVEHARRAVTLSPDYPPNLLALAESLAAVDEVEASRAAYQAALARAEGEVFSDNPDALEWIREARNALGAETG